MAKATAAKKAPAKKAPAKKAPAKKAPAKKAPAKKAVSSSAAACLAWPPGKLVHRKTQPVPEARELDPGFDYFILVADKSGAWMLIGEVYIENGVEYFGYVNDISLYVPRKKGETIGLAFQASQVHSAYTSAADFKAKFNAKYNSNTKFYVHSAW